MSALASPARRTRPRRLVIADDCVDTRRMIRTALSGVFFEILESADGRSLFWILEEHLRSIKEDVPDLLVIADVSMPVYSGLDALEAWSDMKRSFPFIVLSSAPDDEVRGRVQAMGALLLRKPFTSRKLCRMVEQII